MTSHKKKRYSLATRIQLWISAQAAYGLCAVVSLTPERYLPVVARGLGTLSYYLLGDRRKTALKNLRLVWGNTMTTAQRKCLIKSLFKNIARDLLEVVYLYGKPQQIRAMNITVRGQEHLDNALKKGCGVIAVSAHIGNFPLIGCQLALMGYPSWLIFKSPKNPSVARRFREWMDRVGINVIPYKPRRVCARESLMVLKKNGIVQLLIDQNPRKQYGAYVRFFGYEVPTYTGPIIMARRSGAALVPLFMHRRDDGRQVLTILPEVSLDEAKVRKNAVAKNVRTVNQLYEEWISAYPSQWWWIHRRFRRARNSALHVKRRRG